MRRIDLIRLSLYAVVLVTLASSGCGGGGGDGRGVAGMVTDEASTTAAEEPLGTTRAKPAYDVDVYVKSAVTGANLTGAQVFINGRSRGLTAWQWNRNQPLLFVTGINLGCTLKASHPKYVVASKTLTSLAPYSSVDKRYYTSIALQPAKGRVKGTAAVLLPGGTTGNITVQLRSNGRTLQTTHVDPLRKNYEFTQVPTEVPLSVYAEYSARPIFGSTERRGITVAAGGCQIVNLVIDRVGFR